MPGKISPIFRLFGKQYEEGKSAFMSLSKRYRSKKAIELEQKLIFLEIYIDLLSKIHFEKENLKFELFSPFKKIFKGLKKTKHLKMVIDQTVEFGLENNSAFKSYLKSIQSEKDKLYAEVYDLIVGSPLNVWETLYEKAYQYSIGLKPLMINTATTQIVNEELEFFNLENKDKLDTKAMKDIYEGIRVITALENLRIESGFNPIFVEEVHLRMEELQQLLLEWYKNHIILLHLTAFLSDKDIVSKKQMDLLATLNVNKRNTTHSVGEKCRQLFERILE